VTVPRGRIAGTEGRTSEFHSQLLPRYARRTREIDDAILSLGGHLKTGHRSTVQNRPPVPWATETVSLLIETLSSGLLCSPSANRVLAV
jgi:hypothetical protein